ncbi:putative BOI-related E3 ubiquitin-protein ligase 3 [Morella rubra]|uniref:Putative BOI-related E3 ubiquitin-protein ligase 3 n=1 Tax=Morella rubra TaxID=262757 RepID=A0A6A1W4P6_9ROSI|nr:putative BOI-related E3 ubiquitin-protein ligase 3 [Morella rubra]
MFLSWRFFRSSGIAGHLLLAGGYDTEMHWIIASCSLMIANWMHGDRLRQNILEKVQATQIRTISIVEEKLLQKLREKEAEVERFNQKNVELEERMDQLTVEAGAWQQQAKYNENLIAALKFNLQQVYAQSRDSKEGCGDSELDDSASCCNGRSIDFQLLCKENNDMTEMMTFIDVLA